MAKGKSVGEVSYNEDDLGAHAAAYVNIAEEVKALNANREKERGALEARLNKEGEYYPTHLGNTYHVRHQYRDSIEFVPDAEEILTAELPKKLLKRIIQTQTVVRMDVLEDMLNTGAIEPSLAAKITRNKTTKAFYCTKMKGDAKED